MPGKWARAVDGAEEGCGHAYLATSQPLAETASHPGGAPASGTPPLRGAGGRLRECVRVDEAISKLAELGAQRRGMPDPGRIWEVKVLLAQPCPTLPPYGL